MRGLVPLLILATLVIVPAATRADAPKPAPAAAEVEDLDDVKEVVPAKAPDAPPPSGLADVISKLHPAFVHIPIGWLLMVLLLDLAALGMGLREFGRWGLFALAGTALSMIPAGVSGMLREDGFAGAPAQTVSLIGTHKGLMITMASLVLLALVLRISRKNQLEGLWKGAYLVLVFVAGGLIVVGGHVGGKIVFGPEHLPF